MGIRKLLVANRGEIAARVFATCRRLGIRTVASRSIPVRLKRKALGEGVERFYQRTAKAQSEPLKQDLAGLGALHVDALAEAGPEPLAELSDRAADVWEPLLAIADLAGGEWPQRARTAAVALSGKASTSDPSTRVRLLADCRAAFDGPDRFQPRT